MKKMKGLSLFALTVNRFGAKPTNKAEIRIQTATKRLITFWVLFLNKQLNNFILSSIEIYYKYYKVYY